VALKSEAIKIAREYQAQRPANSGLSLEGEEVGGKRGGAEVKTSNPGGRMDRFTSEVS